MPTQLASKRHHVPDTVDLVEFCFQQGWSDGLPVVPPTVDRVQTMLEAAGLDAKQEIGFITHRSVSITAEKVAINAVMAGCKPEYMPVVVAAIEGNAGDNLFGPGWRSNLAIGRALRLVMRNVCGSLPGLLDRGTLGHPGKLSYVIAENEAESPWTPLHVERGFRPEQSAVTIMAANGPSQFYNQLSNTAEGVLTTLADNMRISGGVMGQPNYAVILAGEHMRTIAASGWGKGEIRKFRWGHTQNSHAHLKRTQLMPGAVQAGDETKMRPLVDKPEHFLVVAAGGRAGAFSAYVPGWGSHRNSQAVTKAIKHRGV